ncbi:sulfurtransferase [Leifsonia sp. C5G2]|nr:sulfurtransferase [Leifsonia sp. C5G2]
MASALDGPLVSTQWLADHLGAEGLVVLDATAVPSRDADGHTVYVSGRPAFAETRIPGSAFADLVDGFSDAEAPFAFTRPGADAFAEAAAAVGVGPETTVVVYDTALGQWASRLWYLFRAFGHDRVAVLDGGLAKWSAEGRPVEAGDVHAAQAAAVPAPAAEQPGFWVDTEEVAAIVDGTRPGALVCGTPARDFAARHIPGSTSAPVARLLDRETNAFLPAAELRGVLADVLAAPGPIVVYCGAGIAAAADALALALLGRNDVLLYDGSLGEWTADPAAPLASAA